MSLFDFALNEEGEFINTREFVNGDYTIAQISRVSAIPFIKNIHYARRVPCVQFAFGLFDKGELVGVVTYGKPASATLCDGVAGKENSHRVFELNRLVIKPDHNGSNLASMLVGKSLRLLPNGLIIVSYADWEGWGHVGYVYQATNWLYTGLTKSRTDKYSEGHSRHYAQDEERRQYRTSKHRYIFITGSKTDRKRLGREIKYPVLDHYPKGDSVHYDTDNPIPLRGKEL